MPTPPDRTVHYIVELWVADIESRIDLGVATKEDYTRIIRHLVEWGGRKALAGLDLRAYAVTRREAGTAQRSIVQEMVIIGIMFRWARTERLIPPSAFIRTPRIRIDPNRFEINHSTPTPSQAARVIAAMPDDDYRLAVVILARTGARVGEVAALRSRDLDEREGLLAFGATKGNSKTGTRRFPLDDLTRIDLAGRGGQGDGALLDFGGLREPTQALRKRLTQACEVAGVPSFTPHGLRRMVVGRLIRARIDPGTAASLTGHSVTVMLRHYQIVTPDDRRAAAEAANLGVLLDPERRRNAV